VTALPLETVADHAIQRVTADLTEHRSYLVLASCTCGATFPDIPVGTFGGIADTAFQAFIAHLANVALEV
jgi:hypothetical protein